MSERRNVKKKIENEIVQVYCPCCGELIPVRIGIQGYGIDENYIKIGGASSGGRPRERFPDISVELHVDLLGLRDGGLVEVMENRSDAEKEMDQRRYDYNKAHGVYGKKSKDDEDFKNVARLERESKFKDNQE